MHEIMKRGNPNWNLEMGESKKRLLLWTKYLAI